MGVSALLLLSLPPPPQPFSLCPFRYAWFVCCAPILPFVSIVVCALVGRRCCSAEAALTPLCCGFLYLAAS